MEDVAYLELKQTLKEKYTESFINNVNVISKDFGEKVVEILGKDYLVLKDEYFSIEQFAEKTKNEFLNSFEYLDLKKEVVELKLKLDSCSDKNADEINKNLHQKLSSLATLNTTLNNKLKNSREKMQELKKSIFSLFDLHKEALTDVKLYATKLVTEEINECIKNFNDELNVIKQNFNIDAKEKEYPFDFDKLELITVTDRLQSDYFDNNDADEFEIDGDVVFSENFDEFKN